MSCFCLSRKTTKESDREIRSRGTQKMRAMAYPHFDLNFV